MQPSNLDAEMAVLGAIILNTANLDDIGTLRLTHFFDPVHSRLYADILSRHTSNQPTDTITLAKAFGSDETLKSLGGVGYLARLVNEACDDSVVLDYAKIITDLAARRAIITACQNGIERAGNFEMSGASDAVKIAAEIETALQRIENATAIGSGAFAGAASLAFLDQLDRTQRGESPPMMKFGLADIDEAIGPIGQDDVIILGGRTSMGKSAVAQQLGQMLAEQGHGVMFFALEMNEAQMSARMLASYARHNFGRLSYRDVYAMAGGLARMSDTASAALRVAQASIASLPIIIDTRGGLKPSEITAAVRKAKRNFEARGVKLGAIIIDHIGEMGADEKVSSDYERASSIARSLKPITKAFSVPVIACVQINREAERSSDKRPNRSMLRDSGRIEEVADTILLTYRPGYYTEREKPDGGDTDKLLAWQNKMEDQKNKLELIVDKARMGKPGVIDLWFDPATTRIMSNKSPPLQSA